MKNIVLNGSNYLIEVNHKECIVIEELESLFTEYFNEFDYILGDYSYNKLRLKGYFNSNNKKAKKYNDIAGYENYLKEFCAVDCPYFLIKKSNNG